MNCLALDLGTKTGFAYNYGDDFRCGTWELSPEAALRAQRQHRLDRRLDCRVLALFRKVSELTVDIDMVVFEDVQFSSSTMQTQLWSSLRAAVWLAVGLERIRNLDRHLNAKPNIDCVPVGTLKKFAGHGGATKEMMGRFLCRADKRFYEMWPSRFSFDGNRIDDNAVDAVWIWRWAQKTLSRAV